MEHKEQRQPGFYWVKLTEELGGTWEIAEWLESWRGYNEWALSGNELYFEDDFFDEIDENRIERGQHTKQDIVDAYDSGVVDGFGGMSNGGNYYYKDNFDGNKEH